MKKIIFIVIIFGGIMLFSPVLKLFSEVTGVVLKDGVPVEGAQIEQRYHWHWNDTKGNVTTISSKDGSFRFEPIKAQSWLARLFPHEPVIQQEITITVGNQKYRAYKYSSHSYQEEFPGRSLRLRCDISHSESNNLVDEKRKLTYNGICTIDDTL